MGESEGERARMRERGGCTYHCGCANKSRIASVRDDLRVCSELQQLHYHLTSKLHVSTFGCHENWCESVDVLSFVYVPFINIDMCSHLLATLPLSSLLPLPTYLIPSPFSWSITLSKLLSYTARWRGEYFGFTLMFPFLFAFVLGLFVRLALGLCGAINKELINE